jgi:23S rRNA (cytosine1962-C5)-methyltransferase
VQSGHPWAFAGEIDRQGISLADGDCVELRDARGRSLGAGLWSNKSQIAWRRYSPEARPFDAAFLDEALNAAVARRSADVPFRRLVWSEADYLPGLVIDQFDSVFVAQALTTGADRALPIITTWLRNTFAPREIILRNDATQRLRDALPLEVRTQSGTPFAPEWFRIEGVEYQIDLAGGQKTGFYLDQREQHLHIAKFAPGRRVLDGFCNQGGFALHAARAGAASVLGIDSSGECIRAASRNAVRNGVNAKVRFLCENMFDWFTNQRSETDGAGCYDLIVIDPPPFARSKDAMDGALRGYKELNLRALRMLAPKGILATYSCSQRIGIESFLAVLTDAAADARRDARVLEITGQPPDHPVLLNFPESHYLKGVILHVE